MTKTAFYKKHNRWTEGLISAAKAVATSTNMLIETADGVISGRNSPEQLIVASNDVAASTAQLVAASRVKASFMSKSQDRLENASKAVTSACRSLVRQVQSIISQRNHDQNEVVDYSKLSDREFKVQQMEQQVYPLLIFLLLSYLAVTNHDFRSKYCSWKTVLLKPGNALAKCANFHIWRNDLFCPPEAIFVGWRCFVHFVFIFAHWKALHPRDLYAFELV